MSNLAALVQSSWKRIIIADSPEAVNAAFEGPASTFHVPSPAAHTPRGRALGLTAGRGERIRTSGLYVPNVALYQAKLHPDASSQISCVSGLTLQRESTQVYQRLTEKGRG